ncbi:MAG: hypothetical protein ACI88G_002088, partial [Woeseiaceae bacterium]
MKTLIRFITKTAAGSAEHTDKIVDSDAITIGRATDQVLHLKDKHARLQHAEIKRQNGELRITTGALAGVSVNGRSQRDALLQVGDVIEVGANILRVMQPIDGVDFAISFELSADARSEDLAADWSTPKSGLAGFSKRRLSWMLVVTVTLFALVLPSLSLLHPSLASLMRGSAVLPDDGLWLAGPVHNAHSATSTECQNCHEALFVRVQDSACMACHVADKHVTQPAHAVLGNERCASCHLEHNEPAQLVNRHQGLCADCHRGLPADVPLEDASDFLDAHPDFKVSLLTPSLLADGSTEWSAQHSLLSESQGSERSNLKFDHQVHLDEAGIVTPDGRRVVECVDCHQPEPGGARMRAITMDEHCSGCHTLNFDAADPTRQVPHGDAEAVMQVLTEYYSAKLLGADPDATEQRIRRPGQALSREDRDRAAAEARVQALAVAEDLFERRACVNCHDVSRRDNNEDAPWYVAPVRLTQSFFPHATFSHAAHDTEVTTCDGCHNASQSQSSADVLIPGIESCRDCHGSGVAWRNNAQQTP